MHWASLAQARVQREAPPVDMGLQESPAAQSVGLVHRSSSCPAPVPPLDEVLDEEDDDDVEPELVLPLDDEDEDDEPELVLDDEELLDPPPPWPPVPVVVPVPGTHCAFSLQTKPSAQSRAESTQSFWQVPALQ
jgi:hypothetical protein